MKASEAAALLSYAAALDGRDASRATAQAWADVLDDHMLYADAMAILKDHYRNSRWPVTPAELNERSRALRAARLEAATRDHPPMSPPDTIPPDDPALGIAWVRAYAKSLADGKEPADADTEACKAAGVARQQIQPREGAIKRVDQLVETVARDSRLPRRE